MSDGSTHGAFLDTAVRLAEEAGRFLKEIPQDAKEVAFKGQIDLVTAGDLGAEKIIIEGLSAEFPSHSLLAEESGAEKRGSDYLWIVDPLDGTTNYAHGLPVYCVSIALARAGQTVLGVVHDPNASETFVAQREAGAFLNGERVRVSQVPELSRSLLATGFPYDVREHPVDLFRQFERFYMSSQGVRRLGAAAIDLAYVGCGRLDGFWESGLKPWDMAAGALIIEEAGGCTTGFSGESLDIHRPQIVASNGLVHEAMLSHIDTLRSG